MSENRDTRFRPGKSGNPKGRPRRSPSNSPAFDLFFEQTKVVKQNGVERTLTNEELLQLQTLVTAMSGNSKAIRTVFGWIIERETWRFGRKPKQPKPKFMIVRERDSDHAFEAMCLLGVATKREVREGQTDSAVDYDRLAVAPWAIKAAFERDPAIKLDEDFMQMLRMRRLHPDQLGDE